MFLEGLLSLGKKERQAIRSMEGHIRLLCSACETFKTALETRDLKLMRNVKALEGEADAVRRQIISTIYEGAFLPYLRPDLCRFVEVVDRIFDLIDEAAHTYGSVQLEENIEKECVRVAFLNQQMSEMLLLTFEAMVKGEDIREKTLAVRIYEKKIDDIQQGLMRAVCKLPVRDFWEGKFLSDFLTALTHVSDIVEDASDYIQIINLSMK